jgi:septal ring factor EnvC (AmiA/AmiB activator)
MGLNTVETNEEIIPVVTISIKEIVDDVKSLESQIQAVERSIATAKAELISAPANPYEESIVFEREEALNSLLVEHSQLQQVLNGIVNMVFTVPLQQCSS